MKFSMYNCDFGVKYNGQVYRFQHVAELQIEDPERNNLTRGANAGDDIGIDYKEGVKEPKRWTIPILNMSLPLKTMLDEIFTNRARVEVFCIDRPTGSGKMARNALLANRPQQLVLDETPESLNVSLEFVSFDSTENFKE